MVVGELPGPTRLRMRRKGKYVSQALLAAMQHYHLGCCAINSFGPETHDESL